MIPKEILSPEIIAGASAAFSFAIGVALTKAQRQAILERDGHQSQMQNYSEETGWVTGAVLYCANPEVPCDHLEVNHILPQRAARAEGVDAEEYNSPWNLITVSKCQHVGYCPSGRLKSEISQKRGG